jgi:hypothetical protein
MAGNMVAPGFSQGSNNSPKGTFSNDRKAWWDYAVKVDLSNGKGSVTMRLVGQPVCFMEYSDYAYTGERDDKGRAITAKKAFPDAVTNKMIQRYGPSPENPEYANCPWNKLRYKGTRRYAQNVFVLVDRENNVWEPRILKQGAPVFNAFDNWWDTRRQETNDFTEDDGIPTSLSSRKSFAVVMKAEQEGNDFLTRKYTVAFTSKQIEITDEMIEKLRALGEPTPEKIAEMRKGYNEFRKRYPSVAEWQDYFAFGFDLEETFKPQQIKSENAETTQTVTAKRSYDNIEESEDDFEIPAPKKPTPAPKVNTSTKPEPLEAPGFDSSDTNDDDDDMDWG